MSSTTVADGPDFLTAHVGGAASGLRYRPDVDGLRAIAVLAVVAFHANAKLLPGGFAGVDVFFVISGFLITGLLLAQAGGVRMLGTFIARRIRRIFPALVLVLACALLAGWQVLLPSEFTQLCRHVAGAAAFVVDVQFWREAGYFDVTAAQKPLLHLWSLAVEEQYYLAWPLLVIACSARVRRVRAIACGLAVASLALNLWWVTRDGAAAFFLLPTRLWELATGALLATARAGSGSAASTRLRRRDLLGLVGCVLLALAFFGLDGTRHYPGGWALLPVLGTAALIHAGPDARPNRALSHPMLVYVGLISFPLYLWHWPALSFARIVEGGELGWQATLAVLVIATILAVLTYHVVELRVRRLRALPTRPLVVALATVALVALAGATGRLAPRHVDGVALAWDAALHDWDYPGATFVAAKVGDGVSVRTAGTGRTVLVIGDSNAQQYAPRFAVLLGSAPVATRVMFATAGSCPPMRGLAYAGRAGCPQVAERVLALAADPAVDDVVFAAQWTAYLDPASAAFEGASRASGADAVRLALEEFTRTLAALRNAGKRVYVVLNIPVGSSFEPRTLLHRAWLGPFTTASGGMSRSAWAASSGPAMLRLKTAAERGGATVIDPADALCAGGHCAAVDGAGVPLYRDGYHLRASFVRDHVRYLDAIVLRDG